MARTLTQRLWEEIDKLKALLNRNPEVPIQEARGLVDDLEKIVEKLRARELRSA